MDNSDIVDDIFSRVREILGDSFDGEIALKLEREEDFIRREWGGSDIYIPKKKRSDREARKKAAINDVNKGIPVKDAVRKNGISRAQVYKLLRNK